ncbi:ComEC/Rec2 family competence protein [Halalkalibacter urbisdiaboli]|uniref:ComEC/Rec2 family competence protein n=1 Tax=Halalkalibacter urbisdiaboli TaxID=1960589 RepID=UPI000B4416E7|nr:MBL fold metallo-hydrolase [Halalkalibacter urbisdiaboli]
MRFRNYDNNWGSLLVYIVILVSMSGLALYFQDDRSKGEHVVSAEREWVKSNTFFDTQHDSGVLSIRYFYLEADEKSGDAILIKSPEGKTMMIDTGMVATGQQLKESLDRLNINRIDLAIATHPHHDHIGGYETLLKEKEVSVLMMPNLTHSTNTYKNFINVIGEEQINVRYLHAGDQFYLGDDITVEVLNPGVEELGPKTDRTTAEINNLALVLKVTYKERSFLFTSDIYKKQEKKLIKLYGKRLKADFLHAPHHGDKTSSTNKFIATVQPEYTVISSNILQSKRIVERYKRNGSQVFSTSWNRHLLIQSNGVDIEVYPELRPK